MKKIAAIVCGILMGAGVFAQGNDPIVGKWKTVDDETGEAKSVVEIFKKPDGKYYGNIHKLLAKPENDKCAKCTGDRKDKPLLGLEIIRGLSKKGNEFTGGNITDPKNGKTYKCTITRSGDKLNVRGYVGFSLLGRTQTWHKVD